MATDINESRITSDDVYLYPTLDGVDDSDIPEHG